jgi:hypothetical protein
MKLTSPKRGTAPQQSKGGAITDEGVSTVRRYLRDSVEVTYLDGPIPELFGPTPVLPRRKKVASIGPLPDANDIRIVIMRALQVMEHERSKLPEIKYLRLALRRHIDLNISLEKAFGYTKAAKGATRALNDVKARELACAVFKERFIKGRKPDDAGYQAGKLFGLKKTQALEAFAKHAGHALRFHKLHRLQSQRSPLWTSAEEKRLTAYYAPSKRRNKVQ